MELFLKLEKNINKKKEIAYINEDILKNKLSKKFIKKYKKYYKDIQKEENISDQNIRELVNYRLIYLMENYMKKRTKSFLNMPSEKDFSNKKEKLFIKCKDRKKHCRYKKIKRFFSMNCDDIICKSPNPKELKKELENLFLYLGLENRVEITICKKNINYNLELTIDLLNKDLLSKEEEKNINYNLEITVELLNEEQEKIKENKSKIKEKIRIF